MTNKTSEPINKTMRRYRKAIMAKLEQMKVSGEDVPEKVALALGIFNTFHERVKADSNADYDDLAVQYAIKIAHKRLGLDPGDCPEVWQAFQR